MTALAAIAVTGGAGFLGAAVARAARDGGHRVVTIDVAGGPDVVADVRDREAVTAAFEGIDAVVHAAAVVGVEAVDRDLPAAASVNVVGAVTVFESAKDAGVRRVVDVSSEEVYGTPPGSDPLTEDAPLAPVSSYGVLKAAVERLGRRYPGCVAVRLPWVYGAGYPRSRPPQRWIDDAAQGRPSAPSAGADHAVDLLHVDDAARALLGVAVAPTLRHAVYNAGSGAATTLGDAAAVLRRLAPAWHVELRAGSLPGIAARGALSTARIRDELSWRPDLSLEEGLRRTLHGR